LLYVVCCLLFVCCVLLVVVVIVVRTNLCTSRSSLCYSSSRGR
jgi:hypothetical protein